MLLRLLALLVLLFLPQISVPQQSGTKQPQVPESCNVTSPLVHPFVPPPPYRSDTGINWFGTDRFWTFLPSNGTWPLGEKTFWFRQEWGHYGHNHWISDEDAAKLKVTAKRLGSPAPPAEILKANSSYREQDWKAFLVGGINFPTPGCWEVSGRYESDELTFVVWVVK
jgi:hypothetical protein